MPRMTQAEVNAYNARKMANHEFGLMRPSDACDDEGKLHRDILDECSQRGWIALHGSMAHRAMRNPGEWDFIVIAGGGVVHLVECKTKTGKLSIEQAAMKHWAENLGHKPMVVRSIEEFIQQIHELEAR